MELKQAIELVRLEAKKQQRMADLSRMDKDIEKYDAYSLMAEALNTVLRAANVREKPIARIVLPNALPGLNEYIAAERDHRQKGAKLKRDTQRLVEACARSQLRGFHPTGPVWMKYIWYERNRHRDKDNVSSFGRKVIQDGLVRACVLKNDGWAQIEGFTDEFQVDAKRPRVEVEISMGDSCGGG